MKKKVLAVEQEKALLRALKGEIDKLLLQYDALRDGLADFAAQYDASTVPYEQRQNELEDDIARYRRDLAELTDSPPLAEPEETIVNENPDEDLVPEPGPAQTPEQESTPSESPIPLPMSPTIDQEAVKLKQIKVFFIRRWHQDMNPSKATYMYELNQAFAIATDAAGVLARIPWDEGAWFAHVAGESLGQQWERLNDWNDALTVARERIAQEHTTLTNSWHFAHYQEWLKDGKQKEYLAALAEPKRKEVLSLEETCDMLRAEIASLTAAMSPAEADSEAYEQRD